MGHAAGDPGHLVAHDVVETFVTQHPTATDPHGDRAYTNTKIAAEVTRANGAYEPLVLTGLFAARPSPGTFGKGYYFATDQNGGTLYHSDGTTWAQQAPGVNAVGGGVELAYQETTVSFTTSSTSLVDVTNMTGVAFTTPANGKVRFRGRNASARNDTGGKSVILAVVDSSSGVEYARARCVSVNANDNYSLLAEDRWVLTANTSYTVKLQCAAGAGGNASLATATSPKIAISLSVESIA